MLDIRRTIYTLIGLLLTFIPASAIAQPTASLSGIITYREQITLPADALVTLQIAEVTSQGTGGRVVVEQTFTTNGAQPPFRFNLAYNPTLIDAGRVYTLQGRIQSGGRTLFSTNTLIPVITGNAPRTDIQVVMAATASTSLPAAGSELWLIGVALGVGCLGIIVRSIRRSTR
ncbi:YbaY family lipoprotein [Chloroflexus sp.]|uniref:YbaY family lipoprotein n=1 Tax=Chloroflexus sp. TaxID=1904827 RepID=UPI002ADDE476|nr:YbaY family lipoprotein [Chloroflexus sp.]